MILLLGGTSSSQNQRQKVGCWLPGLREGRDGELLFDGFEVSVCDHVKSPGDGRW